MSHRKALMQDLQSVRTELELAAFLRVVRKAYGFRFFTIVEIPAASVEKLSPLIGLTDAPLDLFDEYDKLGLLRNSPVFAELRRTTAPIVWDLARTRSDRPDDEAMVSRSFNAQYDLTRGAIFPVHGADGRRAGALFMGNRDALTEEETSDLALIVIHAFDLYDRIHNRRNDTPHKLTGRELEVLQWAANGKTSGEIASILSISDHTVNTYMNAAMRKLDCVNRTQLVAKALRLHLIS